MKSIKQIIFASTLALIMVLVSCAKQYVVHAPFLPEKADFDTPAVCRILLHQNDPYVAAEVTKVQEISTAVGIDLVGRLLDYGWNTADKAINDAQNKNRRDKAAKMSAPLVGHGLGDSFRNDFQSSLSAVLSSSPWFHEMPLEMTRENKQVMTTELNQHSVVHMRLLYHLSYDASTLIMQAQLRYFRRGQKVAAYSRYYTYYSEAIGPERDDAAVAKWMSSDQELLRKRMGEGMSEVITMLKMDFFNVEPKLPTDPGVTISVYDALKLSHVQWDGHILHKGNPRILFQESSGNLFSIIPD